MTISHKFARSFIVAVQCLAAGLASAAPAEVHPPMAAMSAHRYPLPSVFRKGLVYLKTSVNGHADAWMILDTGTTDSMIDTDYAQAIGLKLTEKADGAEGFGDMKTATFSTDTVRLQVGTAPAGVVFFESIRLAGMMAPDGMPVAGLLGHSFLEGKTIVIDYQHEAVYIDSEPQAADPRDVAMTLKNGIPIIKLTIAGQKVNALIDSGGTYGMIITPATAKELGIESLMAAAKPVATAGHGGQQHASEGQAPPFSIGKLPVPELNAAYTTFGTATDTIGAGVSMGIGFLKKYKVTLNYPANTIRFEP